MEIDLSQAMRREDIPSAFLSPILVSCPYGDDTMRSARERGMSSHRYESGNVFGKFVIAERNILFDGRSLDLWWIDELTLGRRLRRLSKTSPNEEGDQR